MKAVRRARALIVLLLAVEIAVAVMEVAGLMAGSPVFPLLGTLFLVACIINLNRLEGK